MEKCILEMRGITKSFPGVKALDNVDLTLHEGETLALVGENGAGKSTLLKILSGIYIADSGEISIQGQVMKSLDIRQAHDFGIGIIHQELSYFPDLSVAENIFVGDLPRTKIGSIDWKRLNRLATLEIKKLGLEIPPRTKMRELSVAEQQLVEIVKTLSKDVKILIMDEPTSALNNEETQKLLKLVRELAQKGTSIIYISHRLEEIFHVADRVMVLRDGKNVSDFPIDKVDYDKLIAAMVGREIKEMYPKSQASIGEKVLEVDNLFAKDVFDISFDICAGEVVGIFGLLGSGRTALAKTIFGEQKIQSGTIKVHGKQVSIKSPRQAIRSGIAYVPSERRKEGLVLIESVSENIVMASFREFFNGIILMWKSIHSVARDWIKKLGIRATAVNAKVENLSGGNQQKVVIAKWLQTAPQILILNEPTRGIDVGAKVEIYKIIDKLCQDGLGILLISSELPELLALANRFVILRKGRISGRVKKADATQEVLMNYAVGRN